MKGYPVYNKTRKIQKKMLTTNKTHRLQMDEVTTEGHIDNRKTKGNARLQQGKETMEARGDIDYRSIHGKTYNCKNDI